MKDAIELTGPELVPDSGDPERLVILAHGYGANGADLIPLGGMWSELLPNTAFVSPDAPEMVPGMADAYQWFGFEGAVEAELESRVLEAARLFDAFIDSQLARFGLDESRLALVGFSQGTMISMQVALRRMPEIAALVGFSGSLPNRETLPDELKARPPTLLIHGDADDMIPVKALFLAVEALKEHGIEPEWHIAHQVGHGIDQESAELAGTFLAKGFGLTTGG